MDEKNEKLQPQPETAPAQPDAQPETQEVTPASEKAAEPAPAPEATAPAVSRQTQVFKPIQETTVKNMEHTAVFSPILTSASGATPPAQPTSRPSDLSGFDGSTWAYLGWWWLGALITVCTLGVGLAWAQCMFWRWRAKHTVVSGRRQSFDGKGIQLFEKYFMWGALTVVTLGIYGLWVPANVRRWYSSHMFLTGSRRRPAQPKAPLWRNILVAIAAVLAFALLLTGIIALASSDVSLPWQPEQTDPGPIVPPDTTPEITSAPPETTSAPTTPPETTVPPETTPAPTDPPAEVYVVTAKGNLTLRSRASTSGEALVMIPYGTEVTPLEWKDGWAKVSYGEYTGWCSGRYLRIAT